MSEENKPAEDKPIDGEKKSEEQQVTLASKHEWAQLLTDESLKTNAEVTKYKSVDEMARVALRKDNVPTLSDTASAEDIMKFSKEHLKVTEESYTKDFTHKDLAYKYKLPAPTIEAFMKDVKQVELKDQEASTHKEIEKLKKEFNKEVPENVRETRLNAGLKALGYTSETFKETFTELEQAKLSLPITNLGKSQYSSLEKKVDQNDDDLPADIGVLSDNIKRLGAERMVALTRGQPTIEFDKQLSQYKLKYKQESKRLRMQV